MFSQQTLRRGDRLLSVPTVMMCHELCTFCSLEEFTHHKPPHVMGIFLVLLQIKHMMAFIEQEANEKAEEIEAKVKSGAY